MNCNKNKKFQKKIFTVVHHNIKKKLLFYNRKKIIYLKKTVKLNN